VKHEFYIFYKFLLLFFPFLFASLYPLMSSISLIQLKKIAMKFLLLKLHVKVVSLTNKFSSFHPLNVRAFFNILLTSFYHSYKFSEISSTPYSKGYIFRLKLNVVQLLFPPKHYCKFVNSE
jgi:hypothetical protein